MRPGCAPALAKAGRGSQVAEPQGINCPTKNFGTGPDVRRLGFTLQMPIYRYLQAKQKGVAQFQRAVKKNFARR